MYLRRHEKKKGGCELRERDAGRIGAHGRGPHQRIIATLGKLPGTEKEGRVGWEEIARILDGEPRGSKTSLESEPEIPAWAEVNVKRVLVERLRLFGTLIWGGRSGSVLAKLASRRPFFMRFSKPGFHDRPDEGISVYGETRRPIRAGEIEPNLRAVSFWRGDLCGFFFRIRRTGRPQKEDPENSDPRNTLWHKNRGHFGIDKAQRVCYLTTSADSGGV